MKKKMLIAASVLTVAVLAIALFSGCAKIGTKLVESAIEKASSGNVDVNLDNGGVSVKDESGGQTQIGENVKLPEGWPSDTPLYPDVNLSMSTKTKNSDNGKNQFSVLGVATKGSAKDIYGWYKDKFNSGWEVATDQLTESSDGDFAILDFKSSSYEISVMITEADGTTTLTMVVMEQ